MKWRKNYIAAFFVKTDKFFPTPEFKHEKNKLLAVFLVKQIKKLYNFFPVARLNFPVKNAG